MKTWQNRKLVAIAVIAASAASLQACAAAGNGSVATQTPSADGAFTPPPGADAAYATIDVQRLATLVDAPGFTLVNVHIPYEGDIPGTELEFPFNEIEDHVAHLPPRDAAIVLYCKSGRMSQIAAETLTSLGYTNVAHVEGGMNAWVAAGNTLEGVNGQR